MNAIGYVRVSTDEQARKGVSCQDQATMAEAYCISDGWTYRGSLNHEGISGGERWRFDAMAEAMEAADATRLVVSHLDRFARDLEGQLHALRSFRQRGWEVHVAGRGRIEIDASDGFLSAGIHGLLAEHHRKLTAEKTRSALAKLKQLGCVYGQIPLGFHREEDRLVPDPQDQAARKRAQAWRAEGWSLRRIGRALTALGLPSKRAGQQITKGPRAGQTYRGIWTPSAVARLMT